MEGVCRWGKLNRTVSCVVGTGMNIYRSRPSGVLVNQQAPWNATVKEIKEKRWKIGVKQERGSFSERLMKERNECKGREIKKIRASVVSLRWQMGSFAENEVFRPELRPEEKLPCWILPQVNKRSLQELLNTREGRVEVEQHRFVEKPVNTSFGVAPEIAGSSGEKQRKQRNEALAGWRISKEGRTAGQKSEAF